MDPNDLAPDVAATRPRANALVKMLLVVGFAVGGGLATYVVANAATAAATPGAAPSGSASPGGSTTHNCPNMPNM